MFKSFPLVKNILLKFSTSESIPIILLKRLIPLTSKVLDGVNVPIPVLPLASIINGVESGLVSSSTRKEADVVVLLTCREADGVVIPIPILPLK